MQIEHVALETAQLERLREFYQRYFAASASQLYHNPKTGLKTYFLSFQNASRLELMSWPESTAPVEKTVRCGPHHLAFYLDGKEKVDGLTLQLQQDGCRVVSPPRVTGDGYYESCILDPDGNRIELVTE